MLLISALSGCNQCLRQDSSIGENTHVKITGCYTNLYKEEKDILHIEDTGIQDGYEFIIVYSKNGYHVLYQSAKAGWPRATLLLPANVYNNTIRFVVPSIDGDTQSTFTGSITNDGLIGKFINSDSNIILKRQKSRWIWVSDDEFEGPPSDHIHYIDEVYVSPYGCFSNIHYDKVIDKLVGCEFLILGGDIFEPHIFYQCTTDTTCNVSLHESFDVPLLFPPEIKDWKFGAQEYPIKFTLPRGDPRHGEFKGTITAYGLTGTFSSNGERIVLNRTQSYWQ
jgi:hypothetical protein